MKKEFCRDCICLVSGDKDEWICDQLQEPIKNVIKCPEDLEQWEDE